MRAVKATVEWRRALVVLSGDMDAMLDEDVN